jgi:hypothetical protein
MMPAKVSSCLNVPVYKSRELNLGQKNVVLKSRISDLRVPNEPNVGENLRIIVQDLQASILLFFCLFITFGGFHGSD